MNDDVNHGRQEDLDLSLYLSKKTDAISYAHLLALPQSLLITKITWEQYNEMAFSGKKNIVTDQALLAELEEHLEDKRVK